MLNAYETAFCLLLYIINKITIIQYYNILYRYVYINTLFITIKLHKSLNMFMLFKNIYNILKVIYNNFVHIVDFYLILLIVVWIYSKAYY